MFLRVTLGALLIAGFALIGGGIGLYWGILNDAPELDINLTVSTYQSSFIICAHTGEELLRLHAGHNHERVTIDQIPLHVQHAFVAIEDERFFEHNGVDIRGIGRAMHRLVTSGGEVTEGASTITQQLVKNMLDRFESNFVYKLQEQYLAVNFERDLTEDFGCRMLAKEFILESYLNIINLGRSNYGVQAAAQFYYGVNVWELTIAQAATIAAITQNPSRFPPDTRPEANWGRAQHVLDSMLRLGFITEEEHYEAINSNVYDSIVRTEGGATRPIISPFDCFTDALLNSVRDDLMLHHGMSRDMASRMTFTGGLRIYSTQNREMQEIVDRVFLDDFYWPMSEFTIDVEFHFSLYNTVTNQLTHYERRRTVNNMAEAEQWMEDVLNQQMTSQHEIRDRSPLFTPQPQAAFVLLDHHTGHVLALRGVRGERGANRSFNRATMALRSPGSQLKTVGVFGPAFDLGIMHPATIIVDQPFTYVDPWGGGTWTPNNWWGSSFRGPQTARAAVYDSLNVVSARAAVDPTITHLGIDVMFSYLRNMGISTLVDGQDGAAVSLGGMAGVHLIELAGAYGMVANGGLFNPPVLYTMVIGPNGELLLENPLNPRRVFRDTAAYLLIDTMRDTMTRGTGTRANWHNNPQMRIDIPIAGKTGTSQDRRDLGFSGSTPYFTASIWMGNDSYERMSRDAGGYNQIAWRSIMQEIHENLPPRQFPRPTEGRIVDGTICARSGLAAGPLCRSSGGTSSDIFDSRFLPTTVCDTCVRITYCTLHGYLVGPNCPYWAISTRVGINADSARRSGGFPIGVINGIECRHCIPAPAPVIPDTHEPWPWNPAPDTGTTPDTAPDPEGTQTGTPPATDPGSGLLIPPPPPAAPPPLPPETEPDYEDEDPSDGF